MIKINSDECSDFISSKVKDGVFLLVNELFSPFVTWEVCCFSMKNPTR